MDMQSQDQQVIDLLTKLKEANGAYPASMLAARREMFMRQAANVGLGLGAGKVLKDSAKGAGTTTASKLLEITLIAALAVEAGTVAFLYRDQIAATVRNFIDPPALVTTQPDKHETLPETIGDLETPWGTSTDSETATATPSGTPGPSLAQETTPSSIDNNGNNSTNVNATPNPNDSQGNHYGQTPRPDRTKENPGNGNGGDNNNNGNNGNNNNNGNR